MSKGLEALKIIYDLEDLQGGRDAFWESYRIIEKELKALEIIKEKEVDVWYLMICIEQNIKHLQFYNEYMKELNGIKLTQEEFDLLKEVLL